MSNDLVSSLWDLWSCTLQKLGEEEQEGWFNITKKITCPWQTIRLLGCEKTIQSSGICFQSCWTVFLFFTFYFHFFFTRFVWNYLVVKMRFKRPTCCICRGTFCIQVSCSNNSAISPTESLSSFIYTTSKTDYKCHFFTQQFIRCTYTVCGSLLTTRVWGLLWIHNRNRKKGRCEIEATNNVISISPPQYMKSNLLIYLSDWLTAVE